MTREVQAVLLLLVGGAVLRISLGDTYLRYVKESMRPWLILSGAFLVVLGVLALVAALRSHRRPHGDAVDAGGDDRADADRQGGHDLLGDDPSHPMAPDLHDVDDSVDAHGTGHGHDHAHGPRSAWLLLLPVAAIFLIAPPALGAYTASRESSTVLAPADASRPDPLPPGDPVPVLLSDYAARAVWDDGRTLVGRTVSMTGFVTPDPAGGWWLTRLQLACCAADAVTTKIKPRPVADLPANTWVTVTGRWVPGGGTQRDDAVPILEVESLRQVPAPRNPYE